MPLTAKIQPYTLDQALAGGDTSTATGLGEIMTNIAKAQAADAAETAVQAAWMQAQGHMQAIFSMASHMADHAISRAAKSIEAMGQI